MNARLSEASGRRFGLKGPRAAAALEELGITIPAQPNSWAPLHAGVADPSTGIIGRLGTTEFFIEESGDAAASIARLEELTTRGVAGAYPVLREDCALVLAGPAAGDVLAQVCNVNLPALDTAARPVVMTLMIGVAVLVMPQSSAYGTIYRMWCDPSFGPYLREEFEEAIKRLETGSAP
jgi:sarcosine oxidase subunit gamma